MLYCKNADCGVYLGSMGADSCSLCGHVDQDAIESAACAERDARIAELEQRNRDLYEDVQRFKEHALNEKAARLELERQLEEARKDAERWRTFLSTRPQSTHEVIIQAIDDAAMRKGKS